MEWRDLDRIPCCANHNPLDVLWLRSLGVYILHDSDSLAHILVTLHSKTKEIAGTIGAVLRCVGSLADLAITETIDHVIIYHSDSLHVGINNRRTNETESALFQIFAERFGFG